VTVDRADASVAGAAADQMHHDLSRLASSWLLTMAGMVSSAAFGFAFSIIVGRGLGARGAGIFFATTALFIIAMSVAQAGAPNGLVRMLARLAAVGRVRELRPTMFVALSPTLAISVALAVLLYVLAPQVADLLLGSEDAAAGVPYLRVLAPFLPLMVAYEVVIAATRGLGSMVPHVVITNLGIAPTRAVLAVVALLAGLGGSALAAAWAVPQAIGLAAAAWALLVIVRRVERTDHARELPAPATGRRGQATEFWRFTWPLGAAMVLQIVLLWLDTILLAALDSAREAGIYKAAGSFVLQGTFAQTTIVLVVGPLLSAMLARGERDRAQSIYQTATWWITAMSWPVYVTLAVFGPLLLELFGDEFVEGGGALRILALTMLLAMAAGPASAALVMSGRSTWNLANTAVALALNVVLNLLLIPPLGMTGAAVAWSVSILVSNVFPGVQLWRAMRLYALGRGFWVVAAAALSCYGALGLLARSTLGDGVAGLVAGTLLASAAYLVVLVRFRRLLQLSFLREAVRMRRGREAGT
jgi:O-antigen/teichoic acid export membrane protein